MCTSVSRACCRLIAENGGCGALVRFVRACNRSKPHVDLLSRAMAIMRNLCRYPDTLAAVFSEPDCIEVLTEQLQIFRDKQVNASTWYVRLQRAALA
jgi:hypothetical protein